MGYETRYSLEIESSNFMKEIKGVDANGKPASVFVNERPDLDDLKQQIAKLSEYDYLWSAHCEWYDHEKDMRSFSRSYPDVLFILSGEGEDSGDLWRAYFKNGKMQRVAAKIVYDKFNAGQLK